MAAIYGAYKIGEIVDDELLDTYLGDVLADDQNPAIEKFKALNIARTIWGASNVDHVDIDLMKTNGFRKANLEEYHRVYR